jgi:hypothetical protein
MYPVEFLKKQKDFYSNNILNRLWGFSSEHKDTHIYIFVSERFIFDMMQFLVTIETYFQSLRNYMDVSYVGYDRVSSFSV